MASAKPWPGKISQKNLMPGQKSAQKPNDWASSHELRVRKLEFFIKLRSLFSLVYQLLHIFCQKLPKPNARAKFTSLNLMPGQKLTPKIPNARARTSVPTFVRESPPARGFSGLTARGVLREGL